MERQRFRLVTSPPVGDGGHRCRMDDVLDRAERVRDEFAAVRESAGSPDGTVVATVDGSGALTGLRFGPRATALPPERLAELVLSAASDAASVAVRRAARLVEGIGHG